MTPPPKERRVESPHSWGPNRRGIHLDGTISLTHIITAVPMIMAVIIFGFDLRAKTDAQAVELQGVKKEIVQIQVDFDQRRREDVESRRLERAEILSRVDKVDSKLDQLLLLQSRGK